MRFTKIIAINKVVKFYKISNWSGATVFLITAATALVLVYIFVGLVFQMGSKKSGKVMLVAF